MLVKGNDKITFNTKGKKSIDLNTIMTVFCLSIAFVLTILLSFGARFLFKPSFDSAFWGDLAVSSALCVYCLYFGVPEGRNFYQKKENGRYQNALNQFKDIRTQVGGKDYAFTQWLEKYYQSNKRDFYRAVLSSHGNINYQVLDLDIHEIDLLRKPYKKSWEETEFKGRKDTYFRSLDEKQIKLVQNIFAGKVTFARIPDDFFKTMNGKVITSEYAKQAEENKKRQATYFIMILGRLIMIGVIAFVFNAFALEISKAEGGEEIMQRTISTVSRVWTMASSFVYGLSLGRVMVLDDSRTIEYKARVNAEFLADKDFKPLNEEELAKAEYDKYSKEMEEAKKNIVQPTLVLPYNEEAKNKGEQRR